MTDKEVKPDVVQEQEWRDISNEKYRRYAIVTGGGIGEVTISNPRGLKEVSVPIGQNQVRIDHVILDESGEQHLIEGGWVKISFKLKE